MSDKARMSVDQQSDFPGMKASSEDAREAAVVRRKQDRQMQQQPRMSEALRLIHVRQQQEGPTCQ